MMSIRSAVSSCLTVAVALVAASRVAAAQEGGVSIETVKIADGIYQFITAPDGYVPNGNSIAIVNDDDVLVFDTFTRPSTARKVVAEIRRITKKPVRYVVNSHWHPDHWSGNEVFAREFPGVEIVASEETLKWMRNTGNAWPALLSENLKNAESDLEKQRSSGKAADGTTLTQEQLHKAADDLELQRAFTAESLTVHRTFPTTTYGDALTLRRGSREIRLMSVVGDARGSTVLYLPKEKILITGDVVSFPVPYTTPPLSEQAKTLRTLAAMDAAVIIPGHGPAWRDNAYMNLEAELLESIVRQVTAAVEKGMVKEEDIKKVVDVESLRSRFTHDDATLDAKYRRYAGRMIENACREARDGKIWNGP